MSNIIIILLIFYLYKDMILDKIVTVKVKTNKKIKHYASNKCVVNEDGLYIVPIDKLILYENVNIKVQCDYCNNIVIINYGSYCRNTNALSTKYTCSRKCSAIKIGENNVKKYGNKCSLHGNTAAAKIIQDKSKRTMFEKYEHDHSSKVKSIQDKRIRSFKENIDKFKEKYKLTCLKKYGVDNPSKSYKIKEINFEKYKDKIIKRYKDLDIKSILRDGNIEFKCNNCNEYKTLTIHLLHQRYKYSKDKLCLDCNPLYSLSSFSKGEHEVRKFIESFDIKTKKDRNILQGNELDIYIPDKKLAIEFNGVYWHSELHKNKNYHLDKTELCNEKGIKLIHIWEDDWDYRKEIVKSRLKNELGLTDRRIYARKTKIKEVISKDSNKFLEENHLQGKVNGSIRYGLYFEDELVSLMTFSKKRKNLRQVSKEREYELLRFCNKLNTNTLGGASKLFKHFLKEIKPIEVISYALMEWTNGDKESLYDKLGFEEVGHTALSYWWVVDGERRNRFNFRKDKLIKEGFDKDKTEVEIMHDRGYYRLFGTGNLKYNWNEELT